MGRKVGFVPAVVAVVLACAGSAPAAAASGPSLVTHKHRPPKAAGSVVLCVPSAAGKAVVSGDSAGNCGSDSTKVALPASADEQQTLLSILPHISFVAGDKPTVRFSGVNVQVVNGTGDESTTNGLGNLIIGYNEGHTLLPQTGSHNLVLGGDQSFDSYGGVIGGHGNTLSGPFSAVFGETNTAAGSASSVSGGDGNFAQGETSSVSGGDGNTASGMFSSVSGGFDNTASVRISSISGGGHNATDGEFSSVSGGLENTAHGEYSAVSGGQGNIASNRAAAVFGCQDVTVSKDYASNPSLCP